MKVLFNYIITINFWCSKQIISQNVTSFSLHTGRARRTRRPRSARQIRAGGSQRRTWFHGTPRSAWITWLERTGWTPWTYRSSWGSGSKGLERLGRRARSQWRQGRHGRGGWRRCPGFTGSGWHWASRTGWKRRATRDKWWVNTENCEVEEGVVLNHNHLSNWCK